MRWIVVLSMVVLAFGGYYVYSHRENEMTQGDVLPPSEAIVEPCEGEIKPAGYVRSLSCSSTACHGAIHPADSVDGLLRNEYRVWFDADPHASAARVLGNEVSSRMVKYLIGDNPSPDNYAKVYARCLACHNTNGADAPTELVETPAYFDRDDRYEGVGCEMCHGPASEWKDIHYFACWKELSEGEKIERGLRDTKTLSARAEVCVRCHVGEAGRDVDHDLIAAGHPQMKFEMLGYHTLMPHHWNDKQDDFAGFETQLWSAGQIASAKASLTLLENRTETAASQKSSWPEFSEYDCFACHHDLQSSPWRSERGFTPSGKRVLLPWGVWHFALLPELARTTEDPDGLKFAQELEALKAAMQSTLFADPKLVKAQAAAARKALEAWSVRESPLQIADRLSHFLRERGQSGIPLRNWDEAAQLYLAAYAVMSSGTDGAGEETMEELRTGLGFAEGYQSPKDFPNVTRTKEDVKNLLGEVLRNLPQTRP